MLRLGEDGGIGLFLIFQERSRSYLQAQATRIREGYRLAAFNAGMIMGSLDMGDPVLRLDQRIDIWPVSAPKPPTQAGSLCYAMLD
jgi:hypothetical protein